MFCSHNDFVGFGRLIPYILDAMLVSPRTSTDRALECYRPRLNNISNHGDQAPLLMLLIDYTYSSAEPFIFLPPLVKLTTIRSVKL